eukprot:5608252-Prymnesium_polylepis.3
MLACEDHIFICCLSSNDDQHSPDGNLAQTVVHPPPPAGHLLAARCNPLPHPHASCRRAHSSLRGQVAQGGALYMSGSGQLRLAATLVTDCAGNS